MVLACKSISEAGRNRNDFGSRTSTNAVGRDASLSLAAAVGGAPFLVSGWWVKVHSPAGWYRGRTTGQFTKYGCTY